jgi:hypothetical protein
MKIGEISDKALYQRHVARCCTADYKRGLHAKLQFPNQKKQADDGNESGELSARSAPTKRYGKTNKLYQRVAWLKPSEMHGRSQPKGVIFGGSERQN